MDYEALAKQYGGVVTQPPVDLEALAKQYGGVVAPPPSGIPGPRQPGALAAFGRRAASLADVTLGGVIPAVVQQVGYPLARIGRTPEEAQAATQAMVRAVDQPFGKAFGVANTPEYQTEAGRRLIDFIGQNVQKGAKWISERTGVPVSDVENMIGSAAVAAPRVAAPIAREVAAVAAPVIQDVKAGVTLPFQPQLQARRERLSLEDYQRGPQIEAAKDAQRLGLALNPVDVKSSPGTRFTSMVAGPRGAEAIATSNIPRVQQVGRKEMGLPPTAQLNGPDAFNTARFKVAGPYEEVKKLPVQQADQFVVDGLERLRPNQALIGKETTATAINSLIDDALTKTQGGLNGAQLLDNISSLRADAQKTHRSLSATPAQIDLANTQLAIASQLESMLDSSISNPKLLGQWRDARQKMARIYAYEGATDFNTGLIDIKKLADITAKDNALTGDIAALGRVAGNFPSAFSTTVETPWYSRPSVSRAGPAGTVGALTAAGLGAGWEVGLLAGAGAATAGYLGSRLAANRLASPGYQAGLNIRDMRIPVAEPPLGPTIPQSQAVVPFDPRNALVQPADIIGYASDGTPITASQLSNRPNFVMVPERYGPQVSPVAPDLARALPAPSAEGTMNALRAEQQRAAGVSRTLGQQAEAQQAAAEAAARRPAAGETILDFDPVTGRFRTESQGLPGATPATFQDFGSSLKSAADKATAGRMFDMTAAEKVAWSKTKVDLAEVAPGFKSLNDKAIAAKMMDRQWVAETAQKARDQAQAFEQIAAKAKDAQARAKAMADRERMMDLADSLQEGLSGARPDVSGKQQGPKTREAIRNRLRGGDNTNALAR
jgi:hypothetical protein